MKEWHRTIALILLLLLAVLLVVWSRHENATILTP